VTSNRTHEFDTGVFYPLPLPSKGIVDLNHRKPVPDIAKLKQFSERNKKECTHQQSKIWRETPLASLRSDLQRLKSIINTHANGRYFSWRKRLGLSSDIYSQITFQISMTYHTRLYRFMNHEWTSFRTRKGWRFLYTQST
jgi:hypothetical protein